MSKLAIVYSRAKSRINAPLVRVEVHLSSGLPALSTLGNIKPINLRVDEENRKKFSQ